MLVYVEGVEVLLLAACDAGNALDLLYERLKFHRLRIVMFFV